jgi:hypothetical protein
MGEGTDSYVLDYPPASLANDAQQNFRENARCSPSPIGWERVGVRALQFENPSCQSLSKIDLKSSYLPVFKGENAIFTFSEYFEGWTAFVLPPPA